MNSRCDLLRLLLLVIIFSSLQLSFLFSCKINLVFNMRINVFIFCSSSLFFALQCNFFCNITYNHASKHCEGHFCASCSDCHAINTASQRKKKKNPSWLLLLIEYNRKGKAKSVKIHSSSPSYWIVKIFYLCAVDWLLFF